MATTSGELTAATIARIEATIAAEIGANVRQVNAAITLLNEGATVPFIARYRKEATGGLDDGQLRTLDERLHALRELEARRVTVLGSIRDQGKLTPELESRLHAVTTRSELEDLYLPYRPKRRTRAEIARERGLEPLADAILANRAAAPEALAEDYLSDDVPDARSALDGARDILTERLVTVRGLSREKADVAARRVLAHTMGLAVFAEFQQLSDDEIIEMTKAEVRSSMGFELADNPSRK